MSRPQQEIEHGTPKGYRAHNRRGEQPCRECKVAWARYIRQTRAGRNKEKRP